MRRKNLPRYHSRCVKDTTQASMRFSHCALRLNAAGRGGLHSPKESFADFTVPAPKGYAVPSAAQFHQPRALCEFSAFCFFIIAFQVILSHFIWFVKGFGGKSIGISDFLATSPFVAHTASRVRGSQDCPFFVAEQRKGERKSAKTFPLGSPRHCRATKIMTR